MYYIWSDNSFKSYYVVVIRLLLVLFDHQDATKFDLLHILKETT